jgi:hypothetical protein
LIATYGEGVWTVTPGETRFTEKNQGLPVTQNDRRVWDILVNGNQRYIGTSNGIYVSINNAPWTTLGLQGTKVLALAAIDGLLYAGLENGGMRTTVLTNPSTWQQVSGFPSITVRAIIQDTSGFCQTNGRNQQPILVASDEHANDSGLWILR